MNETGILSNLPLCSIPDNNYNSNNDCHRTILDNRECLDSSIEFHYEGDSNSKLQNAMIYRYKFTQEFMDELFQFSKVHQYDDRHSFKEAWTQWTEENNNLVEGEIRRLTNLDYNGNIEEKMFKSARYYYRKKGTEKNAPIDRRPYVCSQKDLLSAMDEHIKANLCKPSDGFEDFCKNHMDLLKTEVDHMVKNGFRNSDEIKQKIKKTYKNRYFLIANNK
jgi:hypothetical protein